MTELIVRVVDVYPYRMEPDGAVSFLLFHRAPETVYAGQWRMAGGKIQPGETPWQAARREMQEETGRGPVCLWSVPSVNMFYEWQHDRVNVIPAFAAEMDADPDLNHEHDRCAWLSPEEAVKRLLWPEQQRLARLVEQVIRQGIPPELFIEA